LLRNSAIEGFDVEGHRVTGIHTSRGRLPVEETSSVVLCGGSWTGILCDMLGVFCPIYPLKGYTVQVELNGAPGPSRLVFNSAVYCVPAGPRVRIASIGALAGWGLEIDKQIESDVKKQGRMLLPSLEEQIEASSAVVGFRPYSADELPFVGAIPGYSNVMVNAGPGHTGWKAAGGFAQLLAMAMDSAQGAQCESSPPTSVTMLDPAGRMGMSLTGPRLLRAVLGVFS
jgi:glycine/D-amino acid oxidase-like deaminating enzyme